MKPHDRHLRPVNASAARKRLPLETKVRLYVAAAVATAVLVALGASTLASRRHTDRSAETP